MRDGFEISIMIFCVVGGALISCISHHLHPPPFTLSFQISFQSLGVPPEGCTPVNILTFAKGSAPIYRRFAGVHSVYKLEPG